MICPKCNQESNGNFCTYCGTALNQQPVDTSKGVKVVIIRDSTLTGAAIKFKVTADGVEIGSLPTGGSLETTLNAGDHEFVFSMWSTTSTHTISIPNCSTFTIHVSMKMGFLKNEIIIGSTNAE